MMLLKVPLPNELETNCCKIENAGDKANKSLEAHTYLWGVDRIGKQTPTRL